MNSTLRFLFLIYLLACLLSRASAADTGSIVGNVTDDVGKPIARATVLFFRSDDPRRSVTAAVTDKSGRFRAHGLALGAWRLEWKAKGYYEEHGFQEGPQPYWQGPMVVVAEPDNRKVITLVMRRNAILYGRVTDIDGKPITRRTVWLVSAPSMHFNVIHPKVRCDSHGLYKMEFSLGREPGFGLYVPGMTGYGPFTLFTLEDGKRTRVDFQLVRGASISGRVLAADGKTPVAGASVHTIEPNYIVWLPFRAWLQNDASRYSGFGGGFGQAPFPVPARIDHKYDTLHVVWPDPPRTDADGYFDLPLNPDVEYTLHAYDLPRMSVYAEDPKVRLHDGEHRSGLIFLLNASLSGEKISP